MLIVGSIDGAQKAYSANALVEGSETGNFVVVIEGVVVVSCSSATASSLHGVGTTIRLCVCSSIEVMVVVVGQQRECLYTPSWIIFYSWIISQNRLFPR